MDRGKPRRILLIGMRSSGKTTIGAALARRLNRTFLDLDDLTLARFGERSVREVWAAHGEASWRRGEVDALREALAGDPRAIIALGGGTPLLTQAQELIQEQRIRGGASVIYLRASAEVIAQRLGDNAGDRPAIRGDDPATEAPRLLAEREPIYEAMADLVVEADSTPTEEIVASLAAELH